MTEKQRDLARYLAEGMTPFVACEMAGYKVKTQTAAESKVEKYKADPMFVLEMQGKVESFERGEIATADDIKRGLTRMLDVAEADGNVRDYCAAAAQLSKMCGYDQPLEINHLVQHTKTAFVPMPAVDIESWDVAVEQYIEENNQDGSVR